MRSRAATAALMSVLTSSLFMPARGANPDFQQIEAQVRAGKTVFDTTCSAGSCHGTGGVGGRGPALNRSLAETVIRDTVLNGQPGTPMPAFKDILDTATLAEVIAYVSSLSSGGQLPTSVVVIQGPRSKAVSEPARSAAMPWVASNISNKPVLIDSGYGVPAAGAIIFFDASKLTSCHTCHSYAGAGGPIGSDLAGTDKTPVEICSAFSNARSASPSYPAIRLTMITGSSRVGIEREENGALVRYYDVSSLPPVLRTVPKSDVKSTEALKGIGIYDHTKLPYTKQDRLNVCAFLGKAAGGKP